jgi:D-alanyl-D-alanine carboxypeptidase
MLGPQVKKPSLIVLLGLLTFLAFLPSLGCGNDRQGDSGFSDDTVQRLDRAIAKQMQENNLPGVVVGVWVPGEGRYVVARGKANLETGEERDLEDPFRIGSITKTFTATAILQLIEEGKLSKSDKLSKWYPDFPNAEKITIEHLLRMQSGIREPNPWDNIDFLTSPEEVIEASALLGGQFSVPGQRTEYNNINYVLLGEIIRKVTGNDTADRIAKSILKPLGMKNTFYPTNDDLPGDLHGYGSDFVDGELEDMTNLNPGVGGWAGAMISDVSDLKTWAKAVCAGKLLKPQTQKARLQTQHLSGEPDFVEYGEGIQKVGSFCGHPGWLPGFSTQMWYLPEKNATIIVSVNRAEELSFPPPSVPLFATITKILFPSMSSGEGRTDLTLATDLTKRCGYLLSNFREPLLGAWRITAPPSLRRIVSWDCPKHSWSWR